MSHYKPLTGWRVSRFIFVALLLMLAYSSAALADTWSSGQVITYTQQDWGAGGSQQIFLADNYLTVYPTSITIVGQLSGGFVMVFDNAGAISSYLPASGTPGPLDSNLLDPSSSSAGLFGGDVLALQLDVDFSDAGLLLGSSGISFGDLVLENYAPLPSLNGLTVRQILADANASLGGTGSIAPELLDPGIIDSLTDSFDGGTPSVFAQDDLVASSGTTGGGGTNVPEPSSVLLLGVGLLGLMGMMQLRKRTLKRACGAETLI